MNFANVSPSGCATFELYLVVLHLLNQFFQIHAPLGLSPEPGADGSHDVFQRLEYGPLPVLLLFQDHLQALSLPETKRNIGIGFARNFPLSRHVRRLLEPGYKSMRQLCPYLLRRS